MVQIRQNPPTGTNRQTGFILASAGFVRDHRFDGILAYLGNVPAVSDQHTAVFQLTNRDKPAIVADVRSVHVETIRVPVGFECQRCKNECHATFSLS